MKNYEEPDFMIVDFDVEDVITVSNDTVEEDVFPWA